MAGTAIDVPAFAAAPAPQSTEAGPGAAWGVPVSDHGCGGGAAELRSRCGLVSMSAGTYRLKQHEIFPVSDSGAPMLAGSRCAALFVLCGGGRDTTASVASPTAGG